MYQSHLPLVGFPLVHWEESQTKFFMERQYPKEVVCVGQPGPITKMWLRHHAILLGMTPQLSRFPPNAKLSSSLPLLGLGWCSPSRKMSHTFNIITVVTCSETEFPAAIMSLWGEGLHFLLLLQSLVLKWRSPLELKAILHRKYIRSKYIKCLPFLGHGRTPSQGDVINQDISPSSWDPNKSGTWELLTSERFSKRSKVYFSLRRSPISLYA